MSWNNSLALIWTKMVGPSRPTISELNIYTKYAHRLMETKNSRLKLLILGSTPEFRDWGYEENMIVTVMDANCDYHQVINRELRHKTIIEDKTETVIISKWENLDAEEEYDIIIGDLAIGNIKPSFLDNFIERVAKALKPNGLFLGKSFFIPRGYNPLEPKDLIKKYYSGPPYHPYSALAFDLTMYCIDENHMLDFRIQYEELLKLLHKGILRRETMEYFENVGWDSEMKFKFYVPPCDYYEQILLKYMKIINIEYGQDIYSPNFPLYIVEK